MEGKGRRNMAPERRKATIVILNLVFTGSPFPFLPYNLPRCVPPSRGEASGQIYITVLFWIIPARARLVRRICLTWTACDRSHALPVVFFGVSSSGQCATLLRRWDLPRVRGRYGVSTISHIASSRSGCSQSLA